MTERVLRVLEYNKILDIIAEMAVCRTTKQRVSELLPSDDINSVRLMLTETGEATTIIYRRGSLPISPVTDITGAVKRADLGSRLNPSELLAVAALLRVSHNVQKYISQSQEQVILNGISEGITIIAAVEREISSAILSEEEIADNASSELFSIRKKIKALNNKVRDILNDIIHSQRYQKLLQEPIVTMRGNRFVVPVRSEHKSEVPGILHDSSATGATLFIEPMAVVTANNELRNLELLEKAEIDKILEALSAMVAENAYAILQNFETLITLDLIFAKAKFCVKYKCTEPILNNTGYINIKKGRHPLIDPKIVVPIDINIGKQFDTLVITGPNTGGKTVTLKTVGLFTLLAQTGLQVPAFDGTELCVYNGVFADIGDEQSIEQSLSTFSSHMVNIVNILNNLNGNCLVLFDELGAGTDPDEGSALAIAILEFTRSKGAKAIATTHYSEIKLYALSTPGVENASCEFNVETLSPTYRLLIGIPGKSNAFAISKRLGLGENIINAAKDRLTAENVRFEDIISELEQKRSAVSIEYDNITRAKAQAVETASDLEKQKQSLESQKQRLLEKARQEAREILDQATDQAKALIKDIQSIANDTDIAQRLKKAEEIRAQLKKQGNQIDQDMLQAKRVGRGKAVDAKDLKPGCTVHIISMDSEATVVALPNNNGDLQVQMGILKATVNLNDIELIKNNTAKKASERVIQSRMGTAGRSLTVSTELDLRGDALDEALLKVDKYLDDAILASLQKISIIHGKGTGVLRSGIHDYLRKHRFVKSYRLGLYGEGESGVTIVELK